ncbi:hypothetical protein Q3W71_20890 [Micromonospora sp. C28SCA-DRY-2]|uniref:hypothetical protein n=1 Tax=Micromonospora sp. C28SCA-DRY-2 TaxID=3059522 RepID=UPI002674DBE4|nr:hypothetical protein [Micromonospora sp. C28SCA-DRY-2]MDO3704125.1 hypothetical protein [Micromonospora sp. C28SCA-DRY-2]
MEPMRDPRGGLNHIMEALVFSYVYDPQRATFTLVTEYPLKSPGSIREFAAFVFEQVEFERLAGDHAPYQHFRETYHGVGPGGMVVQDIQQREIGPGRHRVELWFGDNFGGVAVGYAGLRGWTRGSTAEQVSPRQWVYRDARDNEEFDLDFPFPSLVGPPA